MLICSFCLFFSVFFFFFFFFCFVLLFVCLFLFCFICQTASIFYSLAFQILLLEMHRRSRGKVELCHPFHDFRGKESKLFFADVADREN